MAAENEIRFVTADKRLLRMLGRPERSAYREVAVSQKEAVPNPPPW
jgi:hypothetical protein